MKKIIMLVLAVLLLTSPVLAATPLTGSQIKQLLSDKTFRIQYASGGDGYQVYFSPDGRLNAVLLQPGCPLYQIYAQDHLAPQV